MGGDVVGLVALDLVLWMFGVGAVWMALVVKIRVVDLDDMTGYVSCLGVPFYVIAYLEFLV